MINMILKIDLRKNGTLKDHHIASLREDVSILLEDAMMRSNAGRWVDDVQTPEGIAIFFQVTDFSQGLKIIESTFRHHRFYPLIKVARLAA